MILYVILNSFQDLTMCATVARCRNKFGMTHTFLCYNKSTMSFELPEKMLDEIQLNIENIINSFDIPDDNKLDVIKQINFMYSGVKQISVTEHIG